MTTCDAEYDRVKEVKQFDESKMGVKGLVDSGITSIPRFFVHPPESHPRTATNPDENLVPVVDLSGATSDRRPLIVDEIRRAFRNPGLFQVINHGIPCDVLNRTTSAIRAFHEQPSEIKSQYYSRERRRVTYFSNIDLFNSKAASWRDTLQVGLAPPPLEPEQLPEICRREVVEWDREVMKFLGLLTELMSEGLGLESGRLNGLTCLESTQEIVHSIQDNSLLVHKEYQRAETHVHRKLLVQQKETKGISSHEINTKPSRSKSYLILEISTSHIRHT